MVTAVSFGPCLSRFAQRAASTSSAVESGPPDTASSNPRRFSRPRNSPLASASVTASAAGTLLFPLDALFHAERGAWIFAQDFAERSTRGFLLVERRQRHAELEQRIGRPRRGVVLGRNRQERFGGVAILLALKQALAEPIVCLGHQPIARILFKESAEPFRRLRIVLVLQKAVGEIVLAFRRCRRRQARLHRSGAARIDRRRWRQIANAVRHFGRRHRYVRQVKRRPGLTRAGLRNRRRRFGRIGAHAHGP